MITAITTANDNSEADTITLTADITLMAVENVGSFGPNGLPVIASEITIAGQGHTVQRQSGAPAFRLLEVSSTGDLTLQETTVSGGANNLGGGILNRGSLTLTSSTVSGNTAYGSGGGIFNFNHANLTLTNSTVSGNSAGRYGGGISSGRYGSLTLTNSTVSANSARSGGGLSIGSSHLTLSHSLLSGNTASFAAEVQAFFSVTTAYNLFGHVGLTTAQAFYGFTPTLTDITATSNGSDPTALADILDPTLQNNGGPTHTHNLVSGSPAIDAAPADADCPPTDQRGVARPIGASCDIGAVEFHPPFPFSGFFATVDNPPVLNQVKAGQAIPVTFSLGGNHGLAIFLPGSPVSQPLGCDTSAPVDDVETTVTAGGSSLSYDPNTDQYTYVWKTDKAWANTCRQLLVQLIDGVMHVATFKFSK